MRGMFLLFPVLAGFILITGCREDGGLKPATEDAARITNARPWGESRSALLKRDLVRANGPVIPIPENLPSPELMETTRRIHQQIQASGVPAELASYTENLPAAGAELRMIAIPGGTFLMGSPVNERLRQADEGPQHEVRISPFWISEIEIPWELYTAFMENGRPRAKDGQLLEEQPDDELWDAVAQPTAPYTAMNLGMGHGYEHGMPAISMSHHAANKFCEWLSAQTGHYYRLPTEAEWEYACRAGSPGTYSCGNEEAALEPHAWYWDNSNDRYQKTGTKKANPWGLKDMHGNVAEWVLDSYDPQIYSKRTTPQVQDPLVIIPKAPHVVRGGSWEDDPDKLRSATRRPSSPSWNRQDPQNPKSLWYLTDGGMIGFRVVRPVHIPDAATMHRLWNFSKGEP